LHSNAAPRSNGGSFLYQLYRRIVLADWLGNRELSDGRAPEPCSEPVEQYRIGRMELFRRRFIWWIGVGLWALFSSVAAPWLVTKALSAGENPLVSLFSAGVYTAQTTVSVATSALAPMTGSATAAGSIMAGTMAVRQSFARRPISSNNGSGSNGSSPVTRS
jgi:hypothetical protein